MLDDAIPTVADDPLDLSVSGDPAISSAPSPSPATSSSSAAATPIYPPAAEVPTQNGPMGIRYDFNTGARVLLPTRQAGLWKVTLRDLDTGNILFETETKGALVRSSKQFFVRFSLDVWNVPENGPATKILAHEYDAAEQDVLIIIPVGTLGDSLAWLPYAVRFWQTNGSRLTIAMSELIIPLVRNAYPNICFITHAQVTAERIAEQAYATYRLGLFFDDADCIFQPTDFRHVGLHRTAAYILGVDRRRRRLAIMLPDETRPIDEPYVCIGVQSSTQSKYWNNPNGWRAVIAFLKDTRISGHLYRSEAGARPRPDLEPYSTRCRGRNGRPAANRTGSLAASRSGVYRPEQRPVLAGMVRRNAGGHDQRIHPAEQRIHQPVPRHQLAHLQRLLERRSASFRSQGLPLVPSSCRHGPAVRMHPSHNPRTGHRRA